jgi:hypothetical protein
LRSITSREKMQLKSQMLRAVNVVEDWIIVLFGSGWLVVSRGWNPESVG